MHRDNHQGRSRGEISADVDRLEQDYTKKTDELGETTRDHEIESETIASMSGLGTIEGIEASRDSLHEAKNVTEGEFTEEADALKESQAEGQELESDLQERSDADSADLEKLGHARQEIKSDPPAARVERAESQTREDIEFLDSHREEDQANNEAAEREYERLQQIVFGAGD